MNDITIKSVEFEAGSMMVTTSLNERLVVALSPFQKLVSNLDELPNWQLCGAGTGLHWPSLDEDISLATIRALAGT